MLSKQTPSEKTILAIETSGDVCSVAVAQAEKLLVEHTFRHGMHLSERLMGQIDAVLKSVGVTLNDVNLLAVGIGPGSFTGTRIGVMTFKTLAFLSGKPVVGVNSLETLAAQYCGLQATIVTPILPCRAGIVYSQSFNVKAERPESINEPGAYSIPEIAMLLSNREESSLVFCGPAAAAHQAELSTLISSSDVRLSVGTLWYPCASQVARLAAIRLSQGALPEDCLSLTPLYISPPPISVPKTVK
jgi:tRNA threonylcarbamoyladenosine biosynthesis protein TsaB